MNEDRKRFLEEYFVLSHKICKIFVQKLYVKNETSNTATSPCKKPQPRRTLCHIGTQS